MPNRGPCLYVYVLVVFMHECLVYTPACMSAFPARDHACIILYNIWLIVYTLYSVSHMVTLLHILYVFLQLACKCFILPLYRQTILYVQYSEAASSMECSACESMIFIIYVVCAQHSILLCSFHCVYYMQVWLL